VRRSSRGTDDAIWDRIRLIPFTRRFAGAEADTALPEKLRAELPGVLAWLVAGCLEWQRSGLGEPERVITATSAYRAEMDTLAGFIEDECVVRPEAWVKFAELYAAYTRWCAEANEHPEKKRPFGTLLTERGFEKGNGTDNVAIRKGIALRHDGGPDPSRINDDSPETGPASPDTPPDQDGDVNSINERAEIVNSQNTCKSGDSNDRINEINVESKTLVENRSRSGGFGKSLIDVTSLIPEGVEQRPTAEQTPDDANVEDVNPPLSEDEIREIKRLVSKGFGSGPALQEVLLRRRKRTRR